MCSLLVAGRQKAIPVLRMANGLADLKGIHSISCLVPIRTGSIVDHQYSIPLANPLSHQASCSRSARGDVTAEL